MECRTGNLRHRAAAAALLALGAVFASPPAAADPGAADGSATRLASVERMIRRFDFEEAETARIDFPREMRRRIAEDRGFPKFGRIELTDEMAYRGRWSLGFHLDGGSLAAEVPAGILPVLPLADYVVTAMVRTSGLEQARVRLVAALTDHSGAEVTGGRAESRPIRTGGAWEMVSVALPGGAVDATHMRIDLELLQPRHFGDPGKETDEPVFEDVSGRAWFDDLTIWHVPRVTLTAGAGSNIIVRPARPTLDVSVSDLTGERLTAELRIEGFDGTVAYETTFPAPRGRHPRRIEIPVDRCGWYRASLTVRGEDTIAGRRELSFVVLPEPQAVAVRDAERMAIVLPPAEPDRLPQLPDLVRALHVRGIIVGIWQADMTRALSGPAFRAVRGLIESLLATDTDMTFALDGVPREIADAHGVDPGQVLELLNQDPESWRRHLEEILVNFGLRVRRWQLGGTDFPDAFWKPDLGALVGRARRALARFIPEPTIIVPFSAEQDIPALPELRAVQITVPHELSPDSLLEYASTWPDDGRDVFVTLEPLPSSQYTPRQQILDTVLRGLYGWRADVRQVAIPAPWRWEDGPAPRAMPDPIYAAWRGLADALRGRRFAGELTIGDGVHCWLMEARGSGPDALVAWADGRPGDDPVRAQLVLAENDVRVIDVFGNATVLRPVDRRHEISLGDVPIFVEGVDLALARFRAGFGFEPSYFPSMHRAHEGAIVISNPWSEGISGSVRLIDTPDAEITPRRHDFVIRPGETVRLPITLIFDRSAEAGVKRIEADVDLSADREYQLRVHANVDLGWNEVDFSANWGLARDAATGADEVVITHTVTNRGQRLLNLDTFLLGPGVGQTRRAIAALPPGATATRAFRLPGPAASHAGRRFRVGVAERGGIAQLNRLIEIPAFVGDDADPDAPPRAAGVDP